MSLIACSGCRRHVRAGDGACPFCGAAVLGAPAPGRPLARLGRAALFAVGATVSVTAAGCDTFNPAPAYGAPPIDAGPDDAAVGVDAGEGIAPLYGGAPGD